MKLIIAITGFIIFIYGNCFAMSGYYSFKDENGVMHFSNVGGDVRFKPVSMPETYTGKSISISKRKIYRLIEKISDRHSIDSRLVKAIVKVESDFNPNAVSKAGARGLMQLMPETAYELRVSNPFSPSQSIDGGVRYFKRLMKSFDNDLKLALAAYNAGKGNVIKYGGIPPFQQTIDYVKKVMSYYRSYKKMNSSI